MKAIRYVLGELFGNIYRIYSIARYDTLAEMRDTNLGLLWKFITPTIRVMTFWFAFGYIFNRKKVGDVPFLAWMFAGMVVWFFVQPCITDGCASIHRKSELVTKMKFPVSVLPMALIMENLFDHVCIMAINIAFQLILGTKPSLYWLECIYYLFSAIIFLYSLSLITSVLNMLARDTRKFIASIMRMLFYLTPIFWSLDRFDNVPVIKMVILSNPIYYIVQGYRDAFFYHKGIFAYGYSMACFWGSTLVLFLIGSQMMYRFRTRFIDTL